MDNFTLTIMVVTSICIVIFGIVAVTASIYGIFVWYPRYRQRRVEALKVSGRQGIATILEVAEGDHPGYVRRAVFIRTPIRLAINVSGIEPYEVNKVFTVPSHAIDLLVKGKVVAVWVDPKEPGNLDKIVIDLT